MCVGAHGTNPCTLCPLPSVNSSFKTSTYEQTHAFQTTVLKPEKYKHVDLPTSRLTLDMCAVLSNTQGQIKHE